MDLSDALGDGMTTNSPWPGQNQQAGGAVWPGQQPNQPAWPGQQPNQPAWPGQQPNQPAWPGQAGQAGQPGAPVWPGGQPGQPAWPGQPAQQPQWPGPQPGQPSQPGWPAQPSQPTAPGWPSPNPGPGPGPPMAAQKSMTVPYDQILPNGLYDKLLLTINGRINPNAKMFTVNLTRGNDIAMHLNPRFDDKGKKTIVRNSLIANNWGKEEREHKQFPFVQGQSFELKILCTASEFRVAVNKVHLFEFKHRMRDLQAINHLGIYNDVTLSSVLIERLP
ncbi:galectin-3b [Hypomesus transpacificus]|uniref:galectin-3b n=1 Tax=Hypomesus transpacificus TaxID=137520 RepID=UPI001F086D3C|nr:galectin-3b [Hypomesus transpacificus]